VYGLHTKKKRKSSDFIQGGWQNCTPMRVVSFRKSGNGYALVYVVTLTRRTGGRAARNAENDENGNRG